MHHILIPATVKGAALRAARKEADEWGYNDMGLSAESGNVKCRLFSGANKGAPFDNDAMRAVKRAAGVLDDQA